MEIGGLVILGILNVPKGGVELGAVVVGEKAGGGGMIGEEAVVGGENTGGGGIMGGGEGDREGWGSCWGLRDNFWSLTSTDPKLTPGCEAMVLVIVFCASLLLGFGMGGQTGIAGVREFSPVITGRGDG